MVLEYGYHVRGSDKLTNQQHSHSGCVEIIQIISGDGNFMIRDSLYPLSDGAVFLVNASDVHCSILQNSSSYIRNKLTLDSRKLRLLAEEIRGDALIHRLFYGSGNAKITLSPENTEKADLLFSEISRLSEKQSESPDSSHTLEITADILYLLQLCANHQGDSVSVCQDLVSRALAYINDNLFETLSLEQIGNAVFSDKYYLCKRFRSETGMTVFSYIKYRRLSIAKQKLQNSDSLISDIAGECGFPNISYFCAAFRSIEGMTPAEYRKKFRN